MDTIKNWLVYFIISNLILFNLGYSGMDSDSSIYVLSNIVHHFINVVSEEARSVPDSFGKYVKSNYCESFNISSTLSRDTWRHNGYPCNAKLLYHSVRKFGDLPRKLSLNFAILLHLFTCQNALLVCSIYSRTYEVYAQTMQLRLRSSKTCFGIVTEGF